MATKTVTRPRTPAGTSGWKPFAITAAAAFAASVVLLNVNVTRAGDPLSSIYAVEREGITPTAKTALYATLAVIGAIVASTGVLASLLTSTARTAARHTATAFALLSLSGIAGLALDVRDGPVRLVQHFAYFAVVLAAATFARLVHAAGQPAD